MEHLVVVNQFAVTMNKYTYDNKIISTVVDCYLRKKEAK